MPIITGPVLALLAGSAHFASSTDKKNLLVTRMKKLLWVAHLEDEFSEYWTAHSNKSEYQALKGFFTEDTIKYALEKEQEKEESDAFFREEEKKRNIIMRVWCYKYEDFIFHLFAPLCEYNQVKGEWDIPFSYSSSVPMDYLIFRTIDVVWRSKESSKSEYYESITKQALWEDCESLVKDFKRNGLIYSFKKDGKEYCTLGNTLTLNWDIVSGNDMNLSKWIKINGEPTEEDRSCQKDEMEFASDFRKAYTGK